MSAQPEESVEINTPVRRLEVVRWVYDTPEAQESEWLEWKRGYDLAERPGAAQTAKHLVGFANRDVQGATRKFAGHAYLLLGVEPGRAPGVQRWDSADIERWLGAFLEPELRYDVHFVRLQDVEVLLIDIDAPRAGDPIFALQRASADEGKGSLVDGGVYVRRRGMTERASSAELKRLQQRLLARSPSELAFHIEMRGEPPATLPAEMLTSNHKLAHLKSLRDNLLSELPPATLYGELARRTSGILEDRNPDEFIAEVDAFIEDANRRWVSFYACFLARENPSWLALRIVGDSDVGYEQVAVEVDLPLPRWAVHSDPDAAEESIQPPVIPDRWGQSIRPVLPDAPFGPAMSIERVDEGTTRIRLPHVDVRPHTPHPLEPFLVMLKPELAGQELTARWRATARGHDGDRSGTVVIPVRAR